MMSFDNFSIVKPYSDDTLPDQLQRMIDHKTKPQGSLGSLERLALRIGLAQNSLSPKLEHPHILIFAADHGITEEGISAYPQEVTAQMVQNFLAGGAAINVFARQNGISLKVIDAGVASDIPAENFSLPLTRAKIGYGTKNFLHEDAMSLAECEQAIMRGAAIVRDIAHEGCTVIGFGEMGIGNTTSAAALMHLITQKPLEYCVGAGAGLGAAQIQHKRTAIAKALQRSALETLTPLEMLAKYGGFEIAMMCGAMMEAASQKMLLLIDGFIVSSALLIAHSMFPEILHYCIFSHESDENGHATMLRYFGVEPILRLGLRLGEGTGVALAYPLVQAAVNFLNEMATFDSANVSTRAQT